MVLTPHTLITKNMNIITAMDMTKAIVKVTLRTTTITRRTMNTTDYSFTNTMIISMLMSIIMAEKKIYGLRLLV